MTFYEMIWQSEFLVTVFNTAFISFWIWVFFWGCAMVRKFFLWRERIADNENRKGAE